MGNDAELYRRFLDGDDNGLVELIDIYNEGLSLYLNKIVENICEAEEVMQETFVKIAIKKPKFNEKCKFKTWLYTIARNCAYDYIRHRSRFADTSKKNYLIEEQKIELHRAMRRIKPDYSQVLYLMYFEDFKTDDIARIMHKSKSQIKDLLYRAKRSLRSELERAGFIYEEL